MCNCVKKAGAPALMAMPMLPQFQPNLVVRERTLFTYVGATALTVVGPATGRRYRFDRPGATQAVDLRDHSTLAAVPHLRVQATATA